MKAIDCGRQCRVVGEEESDCWLRSRREGSETFNAGKK